MDTLRLPETCKVDLAEEEAEGVADEGMMVRYQAYVVRRIISLGLGRAQPEDGLGC
jgi:hypothetical protein